MASISVFGYFPLTPPQYPALTGASSATVRRRPISLSLLLPSLNSFIFDSQRCRTTVAARLADQVDDFSPLRSSEFDRRKLLVSSVGLLIGALGYDAKDGAFAATSQFADMPAIRGKDYGKTKIKCPDYTETPSGRYCTIAIFTTMYLVADETEEDKSRASL